MRAFSYREFKRLNNSPSLMLKDIVDGLTASSSKVDLNWSFHAFLIDCCHHLFVKEEMRNRFTDKVMHSK